MPWSGSKRPKSWGRESSWLPSVDSDGTQAGYDLDLYRAIASTTGLPVVASGGAGRPEHFRDVLEAGADAALAASLFHKETVRIGELKSLLARWGQEVRT